MVAYLNPYIKALSRQSHQTKLVSIPKAESDTCKATEDAYYTCSPRERCTVWARDSCIYHTVRLGQGPQHRATKSNFSVDIKGASYEKLVYLFT